MFSWADVAPSEIAKQQSGWERREMVHRMLALGIKRKEIAARFGVTYERIQQMIQKPRAAEPPIMRWAKVEQAALGVARECREAEERAPKRQKREP